MDEEYLMYVLGDIPPLSYHPNVPTLSTAPQPVPAAQVLPVQAVVTQAPAWLVVADGRTIATFSDEDDAHAYRRWLNRSTTGVEVGS
jgi:hypothetical protein